VNDGERWQTLRERLNRSAFRRRFRLSPEEQTYCLSHGWMQLAGQAERFIRDRVAAAVPANDGKQTPMRGHPVFKAQHATGICCRGCVAQWHGIPAGRALTEDEIAYLVFVIISWLKEKSGPARGDLPQQPDLFCS